MIHVIDGFASYAMVAPVMSMIIPMSLQNIGFQSDSPAQWCLETNAAVSGFFKSSFGLLPHVTGKRGNKNNLHEAPKLPSEIQNGLPKIKEISNTRMICIEVVKSFGPLNAGIDGRGNHACRSNECHGQHRNCSSLNELLLLQFAGQKSMHDD